MVTTRVKPVSTFLTVTLAPLIAAPDVSVTVPRMVPRKVCALAAPATSSVIAKITATPTLRNKPFMTVFSL